MVSNLIFKQGLVFLFCFALSFPAFSQEISKEKLFDKSRYIGYIDKADSLMRLIENNEINEVIKQYYERGAGSLNKRELRNNLVSVRSLMDNSSFINQEVELYKTTTFFPSTNSSDSMTISLLYISYKNEINTSNFMDQVDIVFPLERKSISGFDFEFLKSEDQAKIQEQLNTLKPPKKKN